MTVRARLRSVAALGLAGVLATAGCSGGSSGAGAAPSSGPAVSSAAPSPPAPSPAAPSPPASSSAAPSPTRTAASPTPSGPARLTTTFTTLGTARIGQPVAAFGTALGRAVAPLLPSGSDQCWIRSFAGLKGVYVMLLGSPDSAVRRVDINTAAIRTQQGVGIGSTEAQIRTAYPGKVKSSAHPYVQGGHYLRISSGGHDLLFETDERHIVTTYRLGEPEPVSYIEGCS